MDTLYHQLGNTDWAFYEGTMREAIKILKDVLRRSPSLSTQFSAQQLVDIEQEKGQISGKVWHHYEELTADGRPIIQFRHKGVLFNIAERSLGVHHLIHIGRTLHI